MRPLPLLAALLLAPAALRADASAGQPGAYLRAGAGARAAGMADAWAALAEGPEAASWNPAALAWAQRPALASGLDLLSLDRRLGSAHVAWAWAASPRPPVEGRFPPVPGGGWGAWALGWQGFSLGNDFEGRSSDTASFYSFGDREDCYSLAHGRALLPWLALGAGLKLYDHVLDSYSARGQGLDLGLLALLGPLRLGLSGSELFSDFRWNTGAEERFPAVLRLSLAAAALKGRLQVAGQLHSVQGQPLDGSAGLELRALGFVLLRGGWGPDGPACGAGLRLPLGAWRGGLDYAWRPDPLGQGSSQRLGLELGF